MDKQHLISISESQLRGWQGECDQLLNNVGSVVDIAFLDPDNTDGSGKLDFPNSSLNERRSVITVRQIEKHDAIEFAVCIWTAGDDLCIADLTDEDLNMLQKLSAAVKRKKSNARDGQ